MINSASCPRALAVLAILAAAGCQGSASGVTLGSGVASASSTPAGLARVVFVGKEKACDCTRKSVADGWAALQKALGTPARLPVVQLQIDTQGEQVALYRNQRPIMALPALYFVDGQDKVLELLQGPVTEAEIKAVLSR